MKEAKSEAEQLISAYRAEMEAMYQKSLATVSDNDSTGVHAMIWQFCGYYGAEEL